VGCSFTFTSAGQASRQDRKTAPLLRSNFGESLEKNRCDATGSRNWGKLWIVRGVLVFGSGFLFFDEFVNQSWYATAIETSGQLILCLALGITHEPFVKGLFCSDVIIVIESQFAAFATL
jgi:hypothetical protein